MKKNISSLFVFLFEMEEKINNSFLQILFVFLLFLFFPIFLLFFLLYVFFVILLPAGFFVLPHIIMRRIFKRNGFFVKYGDRAYELLVSKDSFKKIKL